MISSLERILARSGGHMQELLRGASVAFILKVMAAGFSFALNVVLARVLGAEGSGIFFLAFTIVIVMSTIGRVGMENALVRFIAANLAIGKPEKAVGVYNRAIVFSLVATIIISLLLYQLAPWLSDAIFKKPKLQAPLTVMALAVAPLALLTLHGFALQGLKRTAESVSVLSVLVPFITSCIVLLFASDVDTVGAGWSYVAATVITLIAGIYFWRSSTNRILNTKSYFDTRELLDVSIPLFGVMIMAILVQWLPTLFLGVWEIAESVAIYSTANRTSMLTSFIQVAVSAIAAPKFAELYQQQDYGALALVAKHSAKLMLILAAPVLAIFIFFSEHIMSVFGQQFVSGANVLIVLAIGQFINVSTGSVGQLLMMSGNERLVRNNLVLFCAISVGLNALLIPRYGLLGCALATMVVVAGQNLVQLFLVWRKLNIAVLPWK